MNSVELSTDEMYMDMNFRACHLARQNIIISQALLKEDLEVVRDKKGRPLSTHVQSEAVMMYKCQPTLVKVRHDEQRCCQGLPIWHGKNSTISAFLKPISKKVTSVCTPVYATNLIPPFSTLDHRSFLIGYELKMEKLRSQTILRNLYTDQ